jgi:hypothetical protein
MGLAGGPRRGGRSPGEHPADAVAASARERVPDLVGRGGMAANPELAAAVSNSGGLDVLGTHDLSAETIQASRAARMERLKSQLAAVNVALDEAVLDRIDEIVPPGTTINPADNSFDNPALQPAGRRRQGAS